MKIEVYSWMIALAFISFSCGANEEHVDHENTANDSTKSQEPDLVSSSEEEDKYVYGIDISSDQGNEAEMLDKHKDSLAFVISRATDGITFVDPDFESNWKSIKEKGFIRGAYHFYESNDDPKKQVDNYLNTVGGIDGEDLPPIVDFEGAGIREDMSIEAVQKNLLEVLELLEESTNRAPILYTNLKDGDKYLNAEEFAKYTLWVADYSGGEAPTLPGVWRGTEWVLWQKTDRYFVDGKKNDFDVFNGDLEALQNFVRSN